MNWIKKLFTSGKVRKLQEEIELLKIELDKRQDAINKTNAYYKKKLHELQRKKSTK